MPHKDPEKRKAYLRAYKRKHYAAHITEERQKSSSRNRAAYARDPAKYKLLKKRSYTKRSSAIKSKIYDRRKAILNWFRDYLARSKQSCKCGESSPVCLDFHHRDSKDGCITNSIRCKGWSKGRVLTEIAKCDLMCANCHRKLHLPNAPKRQQRRWLWEYKSHYRCGCGESHPSSLDFHHRDPLCKTAGISAMMASGCSKLAILKEIEKCDLMCANCHRKKHWESPAVDASVF